MGCDGVGVGGGGISLWGEAEESGSRSRAKSKAKAKATATATDKSVRSTQGNSKQASSTQADATQANSTQAEQKLTSKQLGEIAEAEFVAKAVGMGFVVAKPWGDSEPYDFIVNTRHEFNFWRVQVKSAHVEGEDGTYSFRAHDHAQRSYSAKDIDALVAYAKPAGAWYVMPVRVVEGLKSLKLYPGSLRMRSKYERWREAWEVLRRAVRRARK